MKIARKIKDLQLMGLLGGLFYIYIYYFIYIKTKLAFKKIYKYEILKPLKPPNPKKARKIKDLHGGFNVFFKAPLRPLRPPFFETLVTRKRFHKITRKKLA